LNVRETARGIVERALFATIKNITPEKFVNWETALLENFLNAQELKEFLDHVFYGISESGGDPGQLQFIHQRGSLPLLQSPVSVVIRFVEQPLRKVDFEARLKAGDPSALAAARASSESLTRLLQPIPPAKAGAERAAPEHARMEGEKLANLIADLVAVKKSICELGQEAESGESTPLDHIVGAGSLISPPPVATLVQVFYATDRMPMTGPTDFIKYESQRSNNGNLTYGKCEVSIPQIHKIGKLETPSILRLEFRPNPKKHIILSHTYSMGESDFFELLRSSIAKSAAKDAFVFVHGYNVSFEDAARRTGQIAYDLDFVGAPIFYSWPSNGKTADYLKDETNITWSTPHFERFLGLLAHESGAERIHIIAHSMGNRAVCDARYRRGYLSGTGRHAPKACGAGHTL
jgi:hypothetical protein